jgi:hypothetical protein
VRLCENIFKNFEALGRGWYKASGWRMSKVIRLEPGEDPRSSTGLIGVLRTDKPASKKPWRVLLILEVPMNHSDHAAVVSPFSNNNVLPVHAKIKINGFVPFPPPIFSVTSN